MSEEAKGQKFALRETFHRTKRTLLLFAAALIVVAYSTTEQSNSIEIAPIKGVLPAVIARLLLTVGLLYYLVGFVLEFLSAKRDHGELKNSTEIADHEQKIAGMANDLEKLIRQVRQGGGSYLGALEIGVAAIKLRVQGPDAFEDEAFDRIVTSRAEGDNLMLKAATPEERAAYYERIRVEVRRRLDEFTAGEAEQFVNSPTRIETAIKQAGEEQRILVNYLKDVSRDVFLLYRRITQFNRHIDREQWWSFFGWEAGGVAVSSIFALLVAWTDFGAWSAAQIQRLIYLPGG